MDTTPTSAKLDSDQRVGLRRQDWMSCQSKNCGWRSQTQFESLPYWIQPPPAPSWTRTSEEPCKCRRFS
jgi:hypothetical protein